MKSNVSEVWELLDSLTIEEKKIIYKRMQRQINSELINILDKVSERAKQEPLSLDVITEEVEKVREKRYEQD